MTHCTADKTGLGGLADGTLPAEERAAVTRHLAGCEQCRREVAQLQAMLAAARGLPREIQPGRDLWPGIEGRLGAPEAPMIARWPGTRSRGSRVMLAAAAALTLMLAGGALATWWQHRSQPAAFATERARYQRATAHLATDLAANPSMLSETTRRVLERNLRIIDDAIREAEAALAEEPGNPALAGMVLARYEQRLELLRRATDAGRQES